MFNKFGAHEEAIASWRRDGRPGLKADSYRYVDFLPPPDEYHVE